MLSRSSVLLRSWVFIRPGPRERMALFIFTLAYVTSWSCRLLLTCGLHYRKAGSSSKDCKNASPHWKVSSNQLRSPKCCSCTNIKSRMAADCFAAAGRLQYTSFQTNSVDLNDALLLSIHDWMDAGSRELYIYDQVHMNGPPDMGRHFWGHLPLSWMRERTVDFTLYYILFCNEDARDDDSPLWVLVLKDTRRQRPHRWTWQFPQQTNSHKLSCYLNVVCHGKGGCLRWAASTTHSCICS